MKDRTFASALHLVVALAHRYPNSMNSELLAMTMRTNPGLVRRLLSRLAKSGLVRTVRGAGGGSSLARPPARISVLDVRRALGEPPVFGGFDKKPFKYCPVSCSMNEILNNTFDRFEDALHNEMSKVKISEMVGQIK
jgi:Rrf2 family protein